MARRSTRFFCILLVLGMILSMMPAAVFAATPSTLYFKASTDWKSDGARFAAYFFGSAGNTWASMTDPDGDGYYDCAVPSGNYSSVIFCRMNGSTSTNNWDNKWNQTANLTIPTDGKNCFTVNTGEWDSAGGTWSTFNGGSSGGSSGGTTATDYYLVGYINGTNYGCEEDSANMGSYKFVDGKLTATFNTDSYVFIKTTGNSNWYMFDGYCSAQTGTLYNTAAGITEPEKMFVPGGVEINFTLAKGSNDTLTLSYTTNTCEHNYVGRQTTAPECNAAGVMTYTCSLCGAGYTEPIAATGHSYVNGKCSVCGYSEDNNIKIHFDNKLGWGGVVAYAWISDTETSLTDAWPGEIIQKDENGLYTLELEYTPKSSEKVGVLFHDFYGNQTADFTLSYSNLTGDNLILQPGSTKNDEGKYPLSLVAETVLSPVINGNKVTFRYQGTTATSVYLAGSMNNWSTSANKMTKSGSVWSITLDLEPGIYEYKFVASSNWVTDPANGVVGGYDGNSVVVVPGAPAADQDKITVKFHYKRSDGNYTNWNVWYWGNGIEGSSAAFTTASGDQGRVATFTVDGSKNSNVGFKIYKTGWGTIDMDYDRFIDLSDVKSGTVHYFVNSGTDAGSRVLGEDAVQIGKPSYANYDYSSGKLWVKSTLPLANPTASHFSILDDSGNASGIKVTAVELSFKDGKGYGYALTLSSNMTLSQMGSYKVKYDNYTCGIYISNHDMFYTSEFAAEYTYNGNDLGATWSANSTTFKVWAPTAKKVAVKIYSEGDYGKGSVMKEQDMILGEKGVWSLTVPGNWDGKYYTYKVYHSGYDVEAVDPYARSTGANGDRGMILNLDATDPEGWDDDVSPNAGMNYTDAIIYELHIREMTLDSSSGVKSAWRGKYLGLTQDGTSYNGRSTGLAHLKELGVTHVQLMPSFDYKSVDEYYCNSYAWGYDPQNYNTPEGSYSTNPHDGKVRVNEYKQMVQAFHSNGINVVMDVVFNHTFDGGNFCYNQIVPNYFSRFYGEGNWSNGSGVGNDLATERTMARNFIVDSIMYWVEEYHIDGFRFDLAGLIDVTTINEIVNTVHAKYPNVIFYGEGWGVGDTAVEYGNALATQWNSGMVPGFGFFSDTFRECVLPNSTSTWGFATGSGDVADALARYMRASTDWSTTPSQIVNYTSCHDNYCLTDKIILTRDGVGWDNMAKMNRLAAATTLLSQGVSFIYSGDEMLREKKDGYGNRYHNGYGASDDVTKIYWSDLVNKINAQTTDDYYAGLIEFRKNHAALRSPNGGDIWNKTHYTKISNNCIMLYIEGGFNYECSSGIVILLNSGDSTAWVDLNGKIPAGTWNACIHGDQAGTKSLWTVDASASVGVEAYSATVLVLGDLVHEESVYNSQAYNCNHTAHNQAGMCTKCGGADEHTYSAGKCTICGLSQTAPETYTIYFDNTSSKWSSVNAYTWTTAGSRTKEFTGTWPGSAMTLVAGTSNVYAIEVPVGVENVIFSCSDNQTKDLKAPAYNATNNMFDGTAWAAYVAGCSHSYTSKVTAPTCTAEGYTTYTCSKCGDTYTDNKVAAAGHKYVATVTAPTCTEGGYTTYTCSACGDSYVADEVDALGHEAYTYSFANNTHSFKCTECGETVTKTATDGKKFAINSAAPILSDDIVLKYRCTIPAGFTDAYIVFEFNGETYYTHEYEVENDGRYSFKFPYVLPQKMADNICATLYAEVNGTQVSVQIAKYSMLQYCFNTLKKPTASKIDRTLYSDVLAYGAAVQIIQGYKTDALVTDLAAAMLAEESAKNEGEEGYPVVQTPSTFPGLDDSYNLQKREGDATFTGAVPTSATIVLGAKVKLRISITCTDLEAYSYKLTLNGREYTYTGADLTPVNDGSDGKYYLYFEGIKAMELCEVLTMTIWEGDTQVGYTLEYSVGTYIYKNVDKSNTTEANRNLMKALFNYGESTKAAYNA